MRLRNQNIANCNSINTIERSSVSICIGWGSSIITGIGYGSTITITSSISTIITSTPGGVNEKF